MSRKNKQAKGLTGTLRQKLGQLLALSSNPQGEPGKPYLLENDGMLSLQFDALCLQSEMNIEDPDQLVFSYTRAMMSFLLFEPSPKRIAMIGLGGGSLAKYCYRYLPHAEIAVVEINPDVIALRSEFAIPADDARFKVLLGDGAVFVKEHGELFDVLMVDGFDTAGLPDTLCSQQFYDDCFASLADNGIMVANLWSNDGRHGALASRIETSFAGRIVVVNADDTPNKIVLAFKNSELSLTPARIKQHVNALTQSHPLNFQAKSRKLIASLAAGAIRSA
ncbi:MAG: fused MFS/spermidine synthase [Gammaproteobacteria bacterium]|nr:fused MFS/spermidine synthase [Gammaproteobacteria bacterium]MBU1777319.1 fused MFS/spermidine synthase [Gammaproteobacteria bacterium]MBU1968309.1 fused MFS/spermidine synthase [Gammaproteobacteria bacterium]